MATIRFDSEASCRAAYIDYHTNKDTNVTEADMKKIVSRYDAATRKSWQEAFLRASKDENRYEFDDDEFEDIRLESYDDTKDEYGEDVNVNGEKARNVGDGIGAGIGALGAAGGTAMPGLGKIFGGLGNKIGGTGAFANGTKGGLIGYILSGLACAFAFAVGLSAKVNKANEEEIEAVNDLYGEMESQKEVAKEQQTELEQIQKDVEEASDKATEDNKAANKHIETKATEHQSYSNTYKVLQAKIDKGQQLSGSELSLYNGIVKIMNSTSSSVDDAITKASETANANKAVIEDFSSDFDVVATNIADVQGVTDYAAEIDEATQKSCKTQSTIQKINSIAAYTAAGGMALATATFTAQVGWPIGIAVIAVGAVLTGLAILGGIWSGKASQEQTEFAKQAADEVDLRQQTQEVNTGAQEDFDYGVDSYNTSKAVIEGLETNKPNDLQQVTRTNTFIGGQVKPNNNDEGGNNKPRYLT